MLMLPEKEIFNVIRDKDFSSKSARGRTPSNMNLSNNVSQSKNMVH